MILNEKKQKEENREIILKFIKNKFKHTETHLYIVS